MNIYEKDDKIKKIERSHLQASLYDDSDFIGKLPNGRIMVNFVDTRKGSGRTLYRTVYYLDHVIDREDGPAFIKYNWDGKAYYEIWYSGGLIHRDGGPAVVWENVMQKWYHNGKLHREDGPAFEDLENGKKEWWIDGKKVKDPTKKPRVARKPKEKKVELRRNYFLRTKSIRVKILRNDVRLLPDSFRKN